MKKRYSEELIERAKMNEKAFCRMDEELKDLMCDICTKNIEFLGSDQTWWKQSKIPSEDPHLTHRLNPDYQQEPDH